MSMFVLLLCKNAVYIVQYPNFPAKRVSNFAFKQVTLHCGGAVITCYSRVNCNKHIREMGQKIRQAMYDCDRFYCHR